MICHCLCLIILIQIVTITSFRLSLHRVSTKNFKNHLFPLENIEEIRPHLPSTSISLWNYYLLEPSDLFSASDLSTKCFFKPKVILKKDDMSNLEKTIFGSLESFLHYFDRTECWISNYLGFKDRGGKRLTNPNLEVALDVILIAATSKENPSKIIGLVELSLELPNGLLPGPDSSPFRSNPKDLSEYQPYVSNLAVDPRERRKGLSRSLCQLVEVIASRIYGKPKMYLHVLRNNTAARNLYESLGYTVLDALNEEEIRKYRMEEIVYYYKSF